MGLYKAFRSTIAKKQFIGLLTIEVASHRSGSGRRRALSPSKASGASNAASKIQFN